MGAGGLLQMKGALDAGDSAMAAAASTAAQLRANAKQELAVGSRRAFEKARETDILKSKMLAIAGVSGGGSYDPTMINLFAQADVEGKLAADTEMYNAKEAARGMEAQAQEALVAGQRQKRASFINAATSLLTTGAAIYKG